MKRAFDFSAALLGLIVLSPLLLLTAALIRVLDGAPVLFKQERIGRLGKASQLGHAGKDLHLLKRIHCSIIANKLINEQVFI